MLKVSNKIILLTSLRGASHSFRYISVYSVILQHAYYHTVKLLQTSPSENRSSLNISGISKSRQKSYQFLARKFRQYWPPLFDWPFQRNFTVCNDCNWNQCPSATCIITNSSIILIKNPQSGLYIFKNF
jgi:hypothetical protein